MADPAAKPARYESDAATGRREQQRGGDARDGDATRAETGGGQAPVGPARGADLEEAERPRQEGGRPAGADRRRRAAGEGATQSLGELAEYTGEDQGEEGRDHDQQHQRQRRPQLLAHEAAADDG